MVIKQAYIIYICIRRKEFTWSSVSIMADVSTSPKNTSSHLFSLSLILSFSLFLSFSNLSPHLLATGFGSGFVSHISGVMSCTFDVRSFLLRRKKKNRLIAAHSVTPCFFFCARRWKKIACMFL